MGSRPARRVRDKVDPSQPLRGVFLHTGWRDISAAQARTLREAGAGHLVHNPKSETTGYTPAGERTAPEPHRYKGEGFEGTEVWRAETLAVVRAIDRELDAAITSGTLIVEDAPLDECRARMLGAR